jgi:hypothetical protein
MMVRSLAKSKSLSMGGLATWSRNSLTRWVKAPPAALAELLLHGAARPTMSQPEDHLPLLAVCPPIRGVHHTAGGWPFRGGGPGDVR